MSSILVSINASVTLLELTLLLAELTKKQDEISQLKQQLEKMKEFPLAKVCVLSVDAC